jgi:hypothetical protein
MAAVRSVATTGFDRKKEDCLAGEQTSFWLAVVAEDGLRVGGKKFLSFRIHTEGAPVIAKWGKVSTVQKSFFRIKKKEEWTRAGGRTTLFYQSSSAYPSSSLSTTFMRLASSGSR